MSRITRILKKPEKARVYVYIDNTYCCSVRDRIWPKMQQKWGLEIGTDICCEDLQEKEQFIWKLIYGQQAWKKEKVRINRVKAWMQKYLPELQVVVKGFGADTTDTILEHPEEQGEPDLSLILPEAGLEIIALEVTGTERRRGDDYWIRPDKLAFSRHHPERDVWIVLHYNEPQERFIWMKPDNLKHYDYEQKNIRGAIEHYVTFSDASPEIKSSQEFYDYVTAKITRAS